MKNKTILDFQGKWTAKINYEPPIVSKSFILNVDASGNISGTETVTIEGNIYDQTINFSGNLTYDGTKVILASSLDEATRNRGIQSTVYPRFRVASSRLPTISLINQTLKKPRLILQLSLKSSRDKTKWNKESRR